MLKNKKLSLLVLPLVTTLSLQATDPMNDPFFNDPFGDDIFKEMMQMQQNMDKMFNRMHQRIQQRTARQIAPLGTYRIEQQNQFVQKGDHYELITSIPKSKENQIDIHTQNGVMSISAKIIEKHENKMANGYSSSSSMRMYQQSIPLPQDADESTLNMDYVNGKLVVSVKKRKGAGDAKSISSKIKHDEQNTTKETNSTIHKMKVDDENSIS